MLKKMLFSPLLKHIHKEEEKTKVITIAITNLSNVVLVHEKNRQNQLIALRKYFLLTQPAMVTTAVKFVCSEYNIAGPAKHDIEEFSKKLGVLLQEKLHPDKVLK